MHLSSLHNMRVFRENYLSGKEGDPLIIVEVGSQNSGGSYREIFASEQWTYIGVDVVAGDNVDVVLEDPYMWQGIKTD